jgi:hypothetical protein
MLQTKARNLWSRRQLTAGMDCLMEGLRELGCDFKASYTEDEVNAQHADIRRQLLEMSLDTLKQRPAAVDTNCNLRNTLLSE